MESVRPLDRLTPLQGQPDGWASVLEAMPDLVAVVNWAGVVEYLAPSARELLGIAPADVVGRRACELVVAGDRAATAEWFAQAQVTPDVTALEHRLGRADGAGTWYETRLAALPSRGGTDRRWLVVARDVSRRRVVDRRVARLAEMWRDISDIVREGIVVVDGTGTVVAANRRASSLLGVPELPGVHVDRVLHLARHRGGRRPGGHTVRDVAAAGGVAAAHGTALRLQTALIPLLAGDDGSSAGLTVLLLEDAGGGFAPLAEPGPTHEQLSPREVEVLCLLAEGLDVRAASTKLGISINTTRNYVKSILRKLDARTQLQAVLLAIRSGLIELS